MNFNIELLTREELNATAPIRRPEDVHKYLGTEVFPLNREAFVLLMVNSRHKVISKPYVVSIGSLNASLVHPREVFQPALLHSACAIIVAHNHPSGSLKPSNDDLDLTGRLDKAGELLGVALLDHIIVDSLNWQFTSVREYGWPTS